ncbi:hypothetical protein [Mycolicibacter sinensis]|jgi:hypothetical protein|uniref:asparaginase n=1 Tax=Mycolicibacter sinensis (strain JDM601) TaxID=875328 RepID=A0A1A2F273_MYCSD|nr:hypothetical protein [Mycolicibacter sinensis]OBG02900.1 hypothetical protein A5772_00675 [Mycolicibacter sinensis]OBG10520.1 hypothetical protein A5771_20380 [Mycolicibacter sinensis]
MSAQDEEPRQEPVEGEAPRTEKPEPTPEQIEEAKKQLGTEDHRPTAVMPGTGGTVSGTAVSDWLDDEGNPKYDDRSAENSGSDSGNGE